jgi:hypothetical protein
VTDLSLPAPPVPSDCDLTDFKFMPLDVARLRDSSLASDETPASCWAAVLLWSAAWHQIPAGSLPDDDRWIAKAAGYASRGRIDKEWASVRDGALRGFTLCSDGRMYHAVVAEKAREAWEAKRDQRWRSECARIKKHNDRHPGANVPKPTFDEWVSQGCPQGHRLYVPGDTGQKCEDVPGDKHSKGQGEGQGQGQIDNPSGEGGKPPSPPPGDAPKKEKTPAEQERSRLWALLKTALVDEQTCTDVKAAGLLLGKQASKYGRDVFIVACRETLAEPRVGTYAYLIATCETAVGKRPANSYQTAMSETESAMANLVPGVASRSSSAAPKGAYAASNHPPIEVEAKHVPFAESR